MGATEHVVCFDDRLEQAIRGTLAAEEITPALLNLLRGVTAAHEHAYHYPELGKDAYLATMDAAWEGGVLILRNIAPNAASEIAHLERMRNHVRRDKTESSILNVFRGATMMYEHAIEYPATKVADLLKLLGQAWDEGEDQRNIRDGKKPGRAQTTSQVVVNFACYLALHGERLGLLETAKAAA